MLIRENLSLMFAIASPLMTTNCFDDDLDLEQIHEDRNPEYF